MRLILWGGIMTHIARTIFHTIFGTIFGAVLLCAATPALSAPVTVPTGLNPGDSYRLVFFTTTTTTATSTDINTYNSFVDSFANNAGLNPILAALGTTWTAIASTTAVDARDNTGTNPTTDGAGVAIYNLSDQVVATGNSDLWDGTIANPIHNEAGVNQVAGVWTGTDTSGAEWGNLRGLGAAADPVLGLAGTVSVQWIAASQNPSSQLHSLYALSGLLTVESTSVAEPGPLSLLALGFVGLAVHRRRRAG
ncbi:MAG: PEP-CTERM sorting domain-containing protein [Alphaproteobacteria bacterium]|nr:PEP-CTERM sorting domain-containing protein [Alphaproteobacteria bacterium]MDP6567222.1 PEP-CTERM sorting domain-containing protein [Alphaproteobacteria bacterium]MDP6812950.1 PEP-CTERM sorting domain-containing protein [Alphaproteobacteria bacterium]